MRCAGLAVAHRGINGLLELARGQWRSVARVPLADELKRLGARQPLTRSGLERCQVPREAERGAVPRALVGGLGGGYVALPRAQEIVAPGTLWGCAPGRRRDGRRAPREHFEQPVRGARELDLVWGVTLTPAIRATADM